MWKQALSLILATSLALPVRAAPACSRLWVGELSTTDRALRQLESAAERFKLSESDLSRLRTRLQKIEQSSHPESLKASLLLKRIDQLLESRWFNWGELMRLDVTGMQKRIFEQEHLLTELRREFRPEMTGDGTLTPWQQTRRLWADSPNLRRLTGHLSFNAAMLGAFYRFTGGLMAPVTLPVLRLRPSAKAMERFLERTQEVGHERALNEAVTENPGLLRSQTVLILTVVIFNTLQLSFLAKDLGEEFLKTPGDKLVEEVSENERALRTSLLEQLQTQKAQIEGILKSDQKLDSPEQLRAMLREIENEISEIEKAS